ncbi:MAG: methyltransferase domain-containing protein [Gemmatimonadota bacterium]
MVTTFAQRTAPPLDRGRLRTAIEDAFTDLALHPERNFHFISGAPLAETLQYEQRLLDGVPRAALASFSGVGNPWRLGPLDPGAHVLDVGCGAGTDVVIASRMVGPSGCVTGIDMTFAMVERTRQAISIAGVSRTWARWGHAEALPLPDASIDVVLCNGVISLTPNKIDTLREIERVMKPGAELRISDVVVEWRLPPHVAESIPLWTDCIGGATWLDDYPVLLREVGLDDAEVCETFDVFSGTRIEPRSSLFGARGANIRAWKRRVR